MSETCSECGRDVPLHKHAIGCSKADTKTCKNGHTHHVEHLDSVGMVDMCPECGTSIPNN